MLFLVLCTKSPLRKLISHTSWASVWNKVISCHIVIVQMNTICVSKSQSDQRYVAVTFVANEATERLLTLTNSAYVGPASFLITAYNSRRQKVFYLNSNIIAIAVAVFWHGNVIKIWTKLCSTPQRLAASILVLLLAQVQAENCIVFIVTHINKSVVFLPGAAGSHMPTLTTYLHGVGIDYNGEPY